MKLELTERQMEALIYAIDVFENSFEWDEEHTKDTKQDIKSAGLVKAKLVEMLGV